MQSHMVLYPQKRKTDTLRKELWTVLQLRFSELTFFSEILGLICVSLSCKGKTNTMIDSFQTKLILKGMWEEYTDRRKSRLLKKNVVLFIYY